MSLKTTVKVGNITNLSDARYCAGMEVNYIGFPLEGEFGLSKTSYTAITEWLEGVEYVLEIENVDAFESLSEGLRFDHVQVNSVVDAEKMKTEHVSLFLSLSPAQLIQDFDHLMESDLVLKYIVIQGDEKLSEEEFEMIDDLSAKYPVLLGNGVTSETVSELISNTSIAGIHLTGKPEIRPGFSDLDDLADVLEQIEED